MFELMNKLFSRWLPCATLATWSAILLHLAVAPSGAVWKNIAKWTFLFSGRVTAFLTPEFRIGVLLSGLAMGVMALVFLLFPADASCCSAADCGHSLTRRSWGKVLTFLILLLPITTAATFSPDGFSASAVNHRGVATDARALPMRTAPLPPPELPLPTKDATPSADTNATANNSTPPPAAAPASAPQQAQSPADYLQRAFDGSIIVEVLDLLYAAQDNALRKDFEGKKVQLIGQLMPDSTNNPDGTRFKAVRMFMTCCAADARPVATLVESAKKPEMPEMAWIKITGTATFPVENGRRIAVLKSDKVEATKPPEEAMLY